MKCGHAVENEVYCHSRCYLAVIIQFFGKFTEVTVVNYQTETFSFIEA